MRLWRRLTLRHGDRLFLDRWGLVADRLGGFYLHRIVGPDPGLDLHDHPWPFVSLVLLGSYTEQRMDTASAVECARIAEVFPGTCRPGVESARRWLSVRATGLGVAHRITSARRGTWTLVLRGPTRRVWSFYPPTGKIAWHAYDYSARRPLTVDGNSIVRPADG